MDHKPIVIVVDDEEIVLVSIRSFLQLETDYDVRTFQSPLEALEHLREVTPDVVISDFLMPNMNGLEFLINVKKIYPDVPRVLLTAYADKENAIKGINEAGLYQYVQKPWDNDSLKLVIRNGISHGSLTNSMQKRIRELDQILKQRDELFKDKNLFQEELLLAQQLHKKLLPQKNMKINGISILTKYRPVLGIGGDFYDVLPLAKGRLAVIIADLTGHGIHAALCTALLKFSFSSFKDSKAGILEIMRGMNDVLYKGLPGNIYAAAMVIVINTRTLKCQIVNGGIPYPYLMRHEEGKVEKININGLVLGMVEDIAYAPGDKVSFQIKESDRLILYSDGLSEAIEKKEGIESGELIYRTLEENINVPSRNLLKKLTALRMHSGKKRKKKDDLTILVIEKVGRQEHPE